jgi:hypothetical protein
MSRRFAVVHEAPADFTLASELADRELVEAIDWLDADQLPDHVSWEHSVEGERFTWKAIPRLARVVGIRAHGHFGGEPGAPDAAAARRALLYILHVMPDVDGIVLIRDRDDEPDRRDGLEQARTHDRSGKPVVIGFAVVERENWVLSGFEPQGDEENARYDALRQELHFDPRTHSHELTSGKDDNATRSPKRVLRALTHDDRDREARCWQVTPLSTLKQRGAENGLAAYLAEVRQYLAPLIGS